MIQKTYDDGHTEIYTYDDYSQLTSTSSTHNGGQSKTTSYQYDDYGRITHITNGSTTLHYEYSDELIGGNLRGQLSCITTRVDGQTLLRRKLIYNDWNQVGQVTTYLGDGDEHWLSASYTFNELGMKTKAEMKSSGVSDALTKTISHTYDSLQRLSTTATQNSEDAETALETFTYDANNNWFP